MANISAQIKDLSADLIKRIQQQQVILDFLNKLSFQAGPYAINNEYLFSEEELESLFKVRLEKKQKFREFLEISCASHHIDFKPYYRLSNVLSNFCDMNHLVCLTHYWKDEAAAK